MKFGGFYEHQLPRPWLRDSEHTLLKNALEQAVLSDQCGYDYVWATEHHFLEEYAHSSAPEVFLAAVSQRTKNVRIGHGIVQTPPHINHPARIAERIATLDLLSDGRVEFGTGAGATETELGGFLVPQAEKKNMQLEGMRVAVRMLVENPFTGYQGRYVNVPPRNVVPKPLQQPHPPLWMACSRRESIIQAAKLGLGALTFSFVSPEEAHQWVKDYYEVMENECEPLGYAVNPNFAVAAPFLCDRDQERVERIGAESYGFFLYGLGHYSFFGEQRTPPGPDRHLGRVQESSPRICAARRPDPGLCGYARRATRASARFRASRNRSSALHLTSRKNPARSVVFFHTIVLERSAPRIQGS
jgi:alkanesulfonate monooxygenase SsuD/methylene tetrahydromethanopterin reductase-like flavin-dependent oxidoreductase (luciferase family)